MQNTKEIQLRKFFEFINYLTLLLEKKDTLTNICQNIHFGLILQCNPFTKLLCSMLGQEMNFSSRSSK